MTISSLTTQCSADHLELYELVETLVKPAVMLMGKCHQLDQ